MKLKDTFKFKSVGVTTFGLTLFFVFTLGLVSVSAQNQRMPGRGLTAQFEIDYLKTTIDHHSAALRMTELAAGTDTTRNAQIRANEGTAPTPGFPASQAKATNDEIKSMARMANRTQREEIMTAQRLLREWYGISYEPNITPVNQARIEILTEAQPGNQFNHLFLEVFSRHHFIIAARSLEAVVSRELEHQPLDRYARSILEVQMNDINNMRTMLCEDFNICDFQPYVGIKGRHSGDDGEIHNRYNRFNNVTRDEDEDGESHRDGN